MRKMEIEMGKCTLRRPSQAPGLRAGKKLKGKEKKQNELVYWGSGFKNATGYI